MAKSKQFKQERKPWFNGLKQFLRIFIKKPDFVYLGDKPTSNSIILTNHEGSKAPLNIELYAQFPIRLWGTYEMNSGLKEVYKYLSNIYFHQKKHWNLFWARVFCVIAAPFVNLFYKGLRLIPTYRDGRLISTIKTSVQTIKEGTNIVIFPENSENGYFSELKQFYAGFVILAERCYKKGIDVSIYVSYYNVKSRKYIFDKPISYSELLKMGNNRDEMADYLLKRCNQLGKYNIKTANKG